MLTRLVLALQSNPFTPHPPSGSQSARGKGGAETPRLPDLSSPTLPGAAAAQRERLVRQRKRDAEVFKKAFAVIDKDGSGLVEPDEIIACLKIFGKDIDRKRFWEVFKEADRDNSESLDIDEFVEMMLSVTDKTRRAKAKRANALSRKLKGGAAQIAQQHRQNKEREKYRYSGRRLEKPKVEEGSAWMDQALAQHRGLADIYASRRRLQRMALGAGLIDPEEDPRLRTMIGRRLVREERQAAAEQNRPKPQGNVAMAALDTFATMFGKEATQEKPPESAAVVEAAAEDSDE